MSIQGVLRNIVCAVTAGAGLISTAAVAAPRIEGTATRECRDTLAVANRVFYSPVFRLDDVVASPRGAPVQVLSQRQAGDISGGDAVAADNNAFKTLPPPKAVKPDAENVRELYWQIKPTHGIRWVIGDESYNWRGDIYTLYAIDPAIPETAFVPPDDDRDPRTILTNAWIPPLMLRDSRSGQVWAVSTQDWDVPETWHIYAAGKDGVKARCTIAFGPKVETAFALLPASVHALAVDLDGTLGNGSNEGSLHPTGRIRDDVAQAWTNIALRPWALTQKPYHSHRNADLGLRHWSRGAPSFRALYLRIQAEYPAAIDALTDLYVQRFAKTPDEARALAKHNLDIVYRSHFVFSQDYIHPAPKGKPEA